MAYVVTAIWLLVVMGAGLSGRVKVNNQPVGPLLGVVLAPIIVLLIGAVFLAGGAVMTAPVWIWLL